MTQNVERASDNYIDSMVRMMCENVEMLTLAETAVETGDHGLSVMNKFNDKISSYVAVCAERAQVPLRTLIERRTTKMIKHDINEFNRKFKLSENDLDNIVKVHSNVSFYQHFKRFKCKIDLGFSSGDNQLKKSGIIQDWNRKAEEYEMIDHQLTELNLTNFWRGDVRVYPMISARYPTKIVFHLVNDSVNVFTIARYVDILNTLSDLTEFSEHLLSAEATVNMTNDQLITTLANRAMFKRLCHLCKNGHDVTFDNVIHG